MEKNRERSGKVWGVAGHLLAAGALIILFSNPGAAAIKRFQDDGGTLHITNEGAAAAPPVSASTPKGRVSGPGGAPGSPGPGVGPLPPHPPEPPKVEVPPVDPALERHNPGKKK